MGNLLFGTEELHFGGGVKVISFTSFSDPRGPFSVLYRKDEIELIGLPEVVQVNSTVSKKGVIRGLHYQLTPPMAKMMRVTKGAAYMVAADINPLSPTFLRYHDMVLTSKDNLFIWASPYFARGYCALEEDTEVQYFCSANFNPKGDMAIKWDDPDIRVAWPIKNPMISARDCEAPSLREVLAKGGL